MKPKSNQHAILETAHICAYCCAQLSCTTQQKTAAINLSSNQSSLITCCLVEGRGWL